MSSYREDVYTQSAIRKVAKGLLDEQVDFTLVHDKPEDAAIFSVAWNDRYTLKELAEEHNPPIEIQAHVRHVTAMEPYFVADCMYDRAEPLDPGYYEIPSGAYLGDTIADAAQNLGCYKREIEIMGMFDA